MIVPVQTKFCITIEGNYQRYLSISLPEITVDAKLQIEEHFRSFKNKESNKIN